MRSLIRTVWLLVIGMALLVAGCAAPAQLPVPTKGAAPSMEKVVVRPKAPSVVEEVAVQRTSETVPEIPRRIIYEAHIVISVDDPEATAEEIAALVKSMGGYVADASLYRYNDKMAGTMTVRVPQERFDEARERIRSLARRVDREELKTNDVTSEYVDLQARLKNLEATEEELRALLTEVRKRAQRASDVLEVYRELTQVRSQIEQIKGRLQMLDKLTTFATITIELRPYELAQPVSSRWDPRITLHRAWGTLVNVFHVLVDAAIYLVVVVLPVLIVVAIPIALVITLIRFLVRRRQKERSG